MAAESLGRPTISLCREGGGVVIITAIATFPGHHKLMDLESRKIK